MNPRGHPARLADRLDNVGIGNGLKNNRHGQRGAQVSRVGPGTDDRIRAIAFYQPGIVRALRGNGFDNRDLGFLLKFRREDIDQFAELAIPNDQNVHSITHCSHPQSDTERETISESAISASFACMS